MITLSQIVSELCSKVEAVPDTGARTVFVLEELHEARIAYEVLMVHGLDVKIYEESGRAKLYYTPSDEPPDRVEKRLRQAFAYAKLLGGITRNLDAMKAEAPSLAANYEINYTSPNLEGHDRRIIIDVHAAERPVKKPAPAPVAVKATPAPAAKSGVIAKPVEDTPMEFSAGPQVAKKSLYKVFLEQQKTQDQDSLYRQAINYLKSQRATTAFWVVLYAGGMLIVYSFFVLAQAYLCPDLATVKKQYWYCSYK